LAEANGVQTALGRFSALLNPKYRADNFSWDNFVSRTAEHAAACCWSSFAQAVWTEWGVELKEIVRETARVTAQQMMDDSGLREWWPHPMPKPESTRVPLGGSDE
jgi:hypothetical protein